MKDERIKKKEEGGHRHSEVSSESVYPTRKKKIKSKFQEQEGGFMERHPFMVSLSVNRGL